jgi:hypothetical protein
VVFTGVGHDQLLPDACHRVPACSPPWELAGPDAVVHPWRVTDILGRGNG